jgi:2-oxoglutarate ferredoxin oxidoreductase subunit gamma
MSKMELRLTGSGGQGVILASVILAEAAVQAGKYTAQSQSYGPEARGGSCKAETIIADEPIGFTKVQKPSFLMALTQASLDKYAKNLPADCKIMIDEDLKVPEGVSKDQVVSLPILRTAREKVGRLQTANIVAVACINEVMGIVDDDTLRKAVVMHIPKGTETLNYKALEEGIALVPADKRADGGRKNAKKAEAKEVKKEDKEASKEHKAESDKDHKGKHPGKEG